MKLIGILICHRACFTRRTTSALKISCVWSISVYIETLVCRTYSVDRNGTYPRGTYTHAQEHQNINTTTHTPLTHWGWGKMAAILYTSFSSTSPMKSLNLDSMSWQFVPRVSVDNNSGLVQIMAWRRIGDRQLSETNDCLVYRRIYASLCLNELRKLFMVSMKRNSSG